MPYEVQTHRDRPILQTNLGEKISPDELKALVTEIREILNALDQPIYNLVDGQRVRVDLGELMEGIAIAVRGEINHLNHPNIIETIVVTRDTLITMGIKGLNVPAFGDVQIKVFPTMEDALTYIDSRAD